ncbi:immunity protein 52 of polymorphic toxin system [Trinickia symbiotica]|uniref:Uncharacterized protein n=1 Tax=Trinickia symbiotica TaxID=863227 RepID=A0A2N7WS49_9BURK|nr:Imm52 family immunity protein [Trinickia symbiotica]PMS32172.1 hypothetical protein C0Z20_27170 [Trinickia symbiotica]PPK41976.1 immunity protein 52 of polymorphic toxin system [Trinickia symbiotica]
MKVILTFRLQRSELPSPEEHLRYLWRVAKLFEPFGFPIEKWYPSAAGTPKKSLANPAFDYSGPTPAAVEMLAVKDVRDSTTNYRITTIWCGKMKGTRAIFSLALSSDVGNPICVLRLQLYDLEQLNDAKSMQRFIFGLLDIWPGASVIEVGPLQYFTTLQVFPQRPGAGWMIYLPQIITASDLPEAAELVPVMEGERQQGTIVVSVAGEVFSVDNPEHVKVANAIEVRLADQDLLCR